MVCEELQSESYGFYVLGSLAGAELAELQAHLAAKCARCQLELAVARNLWYGVGLAAPRVEPRSALRRRVVGLVREPERFRLAWWQPVAGLAMLALAVFVGYRFHGEPAPMVSPVVSVAPVPVTIDNGPRLSELERENQALREHLAVAARPKALPPDPAVAAAELARQGELLVNARQELARERELLAAAERNAAEANRKYLAAVAPQPKPDTSEEQRQLAAARARTQQLEQDLAQYKSLLATARQRLEAPAQAAALLADPNLRLVRLRGTAKGSDTAGHVLLSSGLQAVFYASHLPALPPGRVYQLWLIRASAPAVVSAGIFQPNAQNQATLKFESSVLTTGVTAVAVTDEPESGSVLPTGHKLLIGS